MPFSIGPYRRFPVQCPVTYNAGPFQGQVLPYEGLMFFIAHAHPFFNGSYLASPQENDHAHAKELG